MREGSTNGVSGGARSVESRWRFLDERSDAVSVVSRRMEVIYLNSPARTLVPPSWQGRRCWEVFPVGSASCAARCPAVKAVNTGKDISYCEETIYVEGQAVPLGVAVIPLEQTGRAGEQAVLLLRPKAAGPEGDAFQESILSDARALRSQCEESAAAGPGSPAGTACRTGALDLDDWSPFQGGMTL